MLIRYHCSQQKNGSALESFTADLLETDDADPLLDTDKANSEKEWIAKQCAVSLYLAATDTVRRCPILFEYLSR